MNYEQYHIFVVEGDEQLEVIRLFNAKRRADSEARFEWCKSQGGIGGVLQGNSTVGLIAKPGASISEGWKATNKPGFSFPPNECFVPDPRTKVGKTLRAEMRRMTIKGASDLASSLGCNGFDVAPNDHGQMCLVRSQCYCEGGTYIVLHPKKKDEPHPKFTGLREIKLSEFYALKEKSAAA